MTDTDLARDSHDSYFLAVATLRMLAVASGRALPREEEPIDIVLLAKIGEGE